jgi:amino acid transporter
VSIAEAGHLPKVILKTHNGVPYVAILLTSVLGLLSLLLKYKSVEILFNLLIKICSTAGLLMWLCLLTSYIRFRAYLHHNGIKYTSLPYQSSRPGVILLLAYFAAVNIFIIISINGGPNLIQFSWDDVISSYLTVAVFICLTVALKCYWNQPFLVPLHNIVMPGQNAGN